MKQFLFTLLAILTVSASMNCYGGFVATRKIYHWNGSLGNKWVKTIVMWLMIIIPVYPVAALADFVILNALEFWTGSNPLAMKEGESETQLVQYNGKSYQITAKRNQFEIRELVDGKESSPVLLQYKPEEAAWYLTAKGRTMKVSEATDATQAQVRLFHPDGTSVEVKL
jgi:hypothetical protein